MSRKITSEGADGQGLSFPWLAVTVWRPPSGGIQVPPYKAFDLIEAREDAHCYPLSGYAYAKLRRAPGVMPPLYSCGEVG
jgi:hypothetical protein